MSHDDLARLAEVEPTEEEELIEMWQTWNEEELREFYRRIQDIQERFHRRRMGRVRAIYETMGVKLRIRRPISLPKYIKETV